MDKSAREAIRTATQRARELLDEDFSSQLEATYDILQSGIIASKGGAHLAVRQHFIRDKIVAAIGHKRAAGTSARQSVAAFVRDSAFTTLNRLVALKMLEARKLVQECITKGEQSSGFREFCGLAPGLALLPDSSGYRLYIECLYDEFSTEIKILFDRRDGASVLWPKRPTIEALLNILNGPDLLSIWDEDETIGWVYQFFNSEDERKGMRSESPTPRNGPELAIRNQFFTPRYVVEFLAGNTLGRIWHEMRQGKTRISSECRFLIRAEAEIFLDAEAVESSYGMASEERTTRDKVERSDIVPYRQKKDPRNIKILDPACGSGHFLLLSFNLLEIIYEEAWSDSEGPVFDVTSRTLQQDYPTLDELREAIPSLILRHNLHGVDIDLRATQIAGFALWMRAQSSFNKFSVPRSRRGIITKTNVVLAEAMPGEDDLRDEFIHSLSADLQPIVKEVFEKMKLAGEAGTLLKIDRGLQSAVRGHNAVAGPLFKGSQEQQWDEIEQAVSLALEQYAIDGANKVSYVHRLFSEDAARGFAFIELSRHRYDVVLMNPPFGEFIDPLFAWLSKEYPRSKRDLAACFVDRALELLAPSGLIGALFSRKLLFLSTQGEWRRNLIKRGRFYPVADLGHRVLDGALVEVAAAVFSDQKGESLFISCLDVEDKAAALLADAWKARSSVAHAEDFLCLPSAQLSYETPASVLRLFERATPLEPNNAVVRNGLTSMDNERFVRLFWELPQEAALSWRPISKGGEYSPYYGEDQLLIKWQDGHGEMAAFNSNLGNEAQSRRGSRYYFEPALTYSKRTASSFFTRILPAGNIFTDKGLAVIPNRIGEIWAILAVLNTQLFSTLVDLCVGGGDSTSSGSTARDYTSGLVGMIPFPDSDRLAGIPGNLAQVMVAGRMELSANDETSRLFAGLSSDISLHMGISELAEAWLRKREDVLLLSVENSLIIEDAVAETYGIDRDTIQELARIAGGHPGRYSRDVHVPNGEFVRLYSLSDDQVVDEAAKVVGALRSIVLKSFIVDRKYELLSHVFEAHPRRLVEARRQFAILPFYEIERAAHAVLSFCVGLEFGRWKRSPSLSVAVDLIGLGLPQIQPGAQLEASQPSVERTGILVDDQGHPDDLVARLHQALLSACAGEEKLETGITDAFNAPDLRHVVRTCFFAAHLAQYSGSRRRAPIYWQLATPSSSYSVWLYLHAFTKDTIFRVQNEWVAPKLAHEERKLDATRRDLSKSPTPAERKSLTVQESFVRELRAFLDEVKNVAPLWSPNLEDGAIIIFAPLWRLVSHHKAWQKELKAVWEALCVGTYDWAHLAMHIWPERVIPKCAKDRSIAIGHGLEDIFWEQGDDGKWRSRQAPKRPLDQLVSERTSPAVKAALRTLLDTPPAGASVSRARAARASKSLQSEGFG